MMNSSQGKLYIIATPIGNLKDITLRALEIIREADYLLCEDTRKTLKLLNHYQVRGYNLQIFDLVDVKPFKFSFITFLEFCFFAL